MREPPSTRSAITRLSDLIILASAARRSSMCSDIRSSVCARDDTSVSTSVTPIESIESAEALSRPNVCSNVDATAMSAASAARCATVSATVPSWASTRSVSDAMLRSTAPLNASVNADIRSSIVSRKRSACSTALRSISSRRAWESERVSWANPMTRASTRRSIAIWCSWLVLDWIPIRSPSIWTCSAASRVSSAIVARTLSTSVSSCVANAVACCSTRWASLPIASAPPCT